MQRDNQRGQSGRRGGEGLEDTRKGKGMRVERSGRGSQTSHQHQHQHQEARPKEGGKRPIRTQNCFIEVDILERIKREAHYKKIHFQVLLNQILREAVFDPSAKSKKVEPSSVKIPKECPQCGHHLLQEKASTGKVTTPVAPRTMEKKKWWNRWRKILSQWGNRKGKESRK